MAKILSGRNFCSVCTGMVQYVALCYAWHFLLNDIIFVAFEKKSKEIVATHTNVGFYHVLTSRNCM